MENKTKVILGVGGVAVVLLLLYGNAKATGTTIEWSSPFGNMFPPNSNPQGFESNINVTADPNLLGSLDQKYIPLFGFVGMTTTGSLPSQINITQQNVLMNLASPYKSGLPSSNPQNSALEPSAVKDFYIGMGRHGRDN